VSARTGPVGCPVVAPPGPGHPPTRPAKQGVIDGQHDRRIRRQQPPHHQRRQHQPHPLRRPAGPGEDPVRPAVMPHPRQTDPDQQAVRALPPVGVSGSAWLGWAARPHCRHRSRPRTTSIGCVPATTMHRLPLLPGVIGVHVHVRPGRCVALRATGGVAGLPGRLAAGTNLQPLARLARCRPVVRSPDLNRPEIASGGRSGHLARCRRCSSLAGHGPPDLTPAQAGDTLDAAGWPSCSKPLPAGS
jgi:hypothetical protein